MITATAPQAPAGWQLVFAQVRRDRTGVMTLPLTGYGMDPARSVLETHPAAALAVAAELDAEEAALLACENCHQVKPDVAVMADPYDADVNDTIAMAALCGSCAQDRADDI
jgi:hypothetical protein